MIHLFDNATGTESMGTTIILVSQYSAAKQSESHYVKRKAIPGMTRFKKKKKRERKRPGTPSHL